MATLYKPGDAAGQPGRARRPRARSWGVPLLCAVLALLVFAVYVATSVTVGGSGQPVMPVDDAYIHFQYAHQIAAGQPYVYNPGLPPTSGATSFLYPYLLAVGDLLGFRGLSLGLWAMGIGAVALAASAYLVYRIVRVAAPEMIAVIFAAAFALDGWIDWHFMSGMETGLAILFVLLTFYAVLVRRFRLGVLGMTLLALIRPEGGLLALLAAPVALWLQMQGVPLKQSRGLAARLRIPPVWLWRREWILLIIPVFAVGVQPLINLLITGSAVASGNAAKSLLGITPFDFGYIFGRILDNFVHMWREFVSQFAYVSLAAVVGGVVLARDARFRWPLTLVILWLLAGTAAIATLDTAFWHFKRYQMPLIALFFPLAGVGWGYALERLRPRGQRPQWNRFAPVLVGVGVLVALSLSALLYNTLQFIGNEALNVGYIAAQPLPMARWLAANTPLDARVAVHDVGTMRYLGGRTTIDIVGLTTPGAAAYWRNGPGAVGEFIERERPDYIASYGEGHGLGLGYLQRTSLYAETLAQYTVSLDPNNNVALAAATQGIYKPDWTPADRATSPRVLPEITPYLDGLTLADSIDVADIDSEQAHGYQWHNDHATGGFPTEYYQFDTIGCRADCAVMDGGRRINGEESFTLHAQPGQDLILVTRLHSGDAGTFDVYANNQLISTRVIPSLPGAWLEVPTLIPGALVGGDIRIRIVPHVSGDYQPYYHWTYQGSYYPEMFPDTALATFEGGQIRLAAAGYALDSTPTDPLLVAVGLTWQTDGGATGDAKIFIHIVDSNGQNVAQADVRPGRGALPPGNWLPGGFRDTISVDVSQIPPGTYRIELGLYDPVTMDRLPPEGESVLSDSRVELGTVEVK